MRTLYLDCGMGASGDMLMAALSEVAPGGDGIAERIEALGLAGVRAELSEVTRCGIRGRHVEISVHGESEDAHEQHQHHHHAHRSLRDMYSIIDGLALDEAVKADVRAVYGLIAGAESEAHGCEVGEVHFHEVGALDAVADIAGVCLLMRAIAPERVVVSPVRVGYGTVKCAHGVLPVPAPATASLLKGVPVYAGDIAGEMCTPTGAALIKHFATEFGNMPELTVERIGYGMGSRDFGTANCLRAFVGESSIAERAVSELRCNLDDVTAEELAYAQELLLARGALDVYTQALGMKKSRAGVMLSCLCAREREREFAELILRHTPGLGVRVYHPERITLPRREETVQTEYGPVRVKYAGGKCKAEFEDLARIARETDKPIAEVRSEVIRKL